MSQSSSPKPCQRSNINGSSVKGQVGQAVRDLWQFQFLFDRQVSNTQQDRQNRQALIDKVTNFWVKGVLEKSLHSRAVIELNLEKRLDVVEQPFSMDWATPQRLRHGLSPGTKVIDLFCQMGEGGTLLILGEPGSGKTMALLGLARDLLNRAEQDETQPIPVVFNLSSWRGGNQTIFDWLVQELREKYQVSKALSKTWVTNEQLLLLLDGLDEVRTDLRDGCILALNQFVQEHGKTETVVSSRVRDYEALSLRLKFQGSILIKPLTTEQVNQYLAEAGESLASVRVAIQVDPLFKDLIKTPLILNIVSLTYQEISFHSLPKTSSKQKYISYLFDAYIERMFFRRRNKNQHYAKERVKSCLTFLAQGMQKNAQSIFLIESLQPSWLKSGIQRWIYSFGLAVVAGVYIDLIVGIIFILAARHFNKYDPDFQLLNELMKNVGIMWELWKVTFFLTIGVLTLIGIVGNPSDEKIGLVATLNWSFNRAKIGLVMLIPGILIILLFRIMWINESLRISMWINESFVENLKLFLAFIIIPGFIASMLGLIITLMSGRVEPDIETSVTPNQGAWQSRINSLVFTLVCGVAFGLFFSLVLGLGVTAGLVSGLIFGLILGVFGGGAASIQHFILRIVLYLSGSVPWNYARFLDYATERIFLQKVGGGYIFIHRLLLEHFAQMNLKDLKRSHK